MHEHLDAISTYPPKKISISFHSLENYEDVFKNTVDIDKLFECLHHLQNLGTEVSMTVVFLPENQDEMTSLITFFETKNIKNLKIIYPNDPKIKKSLLDKFLETKVSSSQLDIRISDLEEKSCLLQERGFFCIIIENLSIYNCCITLGQSDNMTKYEGEFDLQELLIKQYKKNIKTEGFACTAYTDSCPIALKKIAKTKASEEVLI